MEQEKTIIDGLTDADVWSGWLEQVQSWVSVYLFTSETLIELGLIVLAASIAWPVSRLLQKKLLSRDNKYNHVALLRRFWVTIEKLAFPMVWLVIQWILVIVLTQLEMRNAILVIIASLLSAWIVINILTVFVANPLLSHMISTVAWIAAALNILGLLDKTISFMDGAVMSVGEVNVSLLTIVQGLITLGLLLWLTTAIGHMVESRIKSSTSLSPSIKVLSSKLLRIALAIMAVLISLKIVGIDLTAFAIFGGAIGIGLGFGLQKIFSNLVSGFILLLDKSIKPGDVIAVADNFGQVKSLGARYASVLTRDGIEYLIPNEELITNQVENWTHSNNLVRIRTTVGVHYKTDVRKAIELCLQAVEETPRILKNPAAVCHLQEFGDSSINLEMRFWINDPMIGKASVLSELQLNVWDKFKEHDIEIPYPQHDVYLHSNE